ncbi:intron-binding protein aquarius [Entomortierella parvispora]|uniref:Pre-mRNA-splicing factor n=1 Tax=Entomortierella parvispora TaxID=205924 RepID=A0A9P3LTK7_9FUNG|nr:intron-binding protein aquarius [Entomortierella parvispora]
MQPEEAQPVGDADQAKTVAQTQHGAYRPTVKDMQNDSVAEYTDLWSGDREPEFDAAIVNRVFQDELLKNDFSVQKLTLLEVGQYLEKYLWRHYEPDRSSTTYILSIVLMVNEKFRSRVPAWGAFEDSPEHFPAFFEAVLRLCVQDSEEVDLGMKRYLLVFMINCFQSLENVLIRSECMRLVSLSTWHCLVSPAVREVEFKEYPQLVKFWKHFEKKFDASESSQQEKSIFERTWLSEMMKNFINILESSATGDQDKIAYCERFLEFLIDLEAQLPTRRFFNTLLEDHQIVTICKLSKLACDKVSGTLFSQLLDILVFYAGFEINGHTGLALTKEEMIDIHASKLTKLQRIAFTHFKDELMDLAMTNHRSIESREALATYFNQLNMEQLIQLCDLLNIRTSNVSDPSQQHSQHILKELLLTRFEKPSSQIERINSLPLYPDENALFEDAAVQEEMYNTDRPLALPKLNLQFLTLHDYLLRNFNLFRLESNYEIRQDIEDAVRRLGPRPASNEGSTAFSGWSRVAAPISFFKMVELGKPNLGEDRLSKVTADVTFNVRKYTDAIQAEWEAIREHDILFLLTIEAHDHMDEEWDGKGSFRKHYGLKYVRGCEVLSVIGPNGKPFDYKKSDPQMIQEHRTGNTRTFRVALDPNQYKLDQEAAKKNGGGDVYQTFNIVLRRKPEENNFKPVLETIRDLMQNDLMIPDWLHDVFLGYGNPNSAHYSQLKKQIQEIDFRDTFQDLDHLKSAFPGMNIKAKEGDEGSLAAPFVVRFPDAPEESTAGSKKKKGADKASKGKNKPESEAQAQDELIVSTYTTPNMGPYPEDIPNMNQIRFTPTQVEAIKAGTNPGLTMVVGPPGTGKTDVAVQIIANLYNNFPNQHTLLVTHSNQALNQLFEKIIALDVDERHLLRLGHGEEELNTELSFSKYGRVTSFLEKRVNLLAEVDRLAQSLEIGGEHGSTCETAGYFNSYHVIPIWEKYEQQVQDSGSLEEIQATFPFHQFFSNAPTPLFSGCSTADEALEVARGCFRHLKKLFEQLEEVSAFELLRTSYDRANYLLTKEAKIIAMTCTHAALKRRELVKLGFKYDNIVMEEAAQILEVETFIPMLLQEPEDGVNRLKRVVLIGDHNQLPPVVKNTAFQQYGNMEQSMFTRFVRLGVPTVQLDAQGRARSEMADLYKWRYKELGDLPNILEREEFKYANPGFKFDFQFVNVDNFNGKGETAPRPHFIQNLGEAEYIVAVYQYMVLLGYPPEKITILTTYNGQKDLIRDVLKQRCSWNPIFGRPAAVTTVDKYQGQQNDYVLLSLVRTKTVGHVRDVRRLIVALSRARLGLYIFGRQKLFENCHELEPAFKQLLARPTKLWLKRGERYTDENRRTLAETAKVDRDSDSEEEEGEDESKPKTKGKKPSKKDKEAKKAAQEKKKAAQDAKNEEKKSYSEIQGVAQMGEYVFGLQKEQQRYALQQQQAYLASMGVPHQGQQQTNEASDASEAMDVSEADKSGKEEDGNAMDVDSEDENTKDEDN